ncbi:MAG: ferritin-like domain-containing protein [Candidatus Nanoarchaeia archaeon]
MNEKEKKIIELAIKKEDMAYYHYVTISKEAKSHNLHEFFSKLSLQELRHKELLKLFLKQEDFFRAKELAARKYPDDFDLLSNLSPTSDTSNLLISIKEAIDRERNSYLMYKELYDGTNNGIVKELFFYLSEEELRHMEKLKSIYKII